jgi:PPK2 family polyphosphate:nucleotide phosphotransferase
MKSCHLCDRLRVKPGEKVRLKHFDPEDTHVFDDRDEAEKMLAKHTARLNELQYLLSAEARHAVLIVLQGLDTAGKDGTIRHVMTGLNPQGCKVTPFKVPTPEEAAHDFLWRIHKAVPARGEVGIFNRSHYEDVLVVRVRNLAPKAVWSRRYKDINDFERILTDSGVTIIKFFLHISKSEQADRLQARMADPDKNWKLSEADFDDRPHWREYTQAYEAALSECSTDRAPWYVIPSNKKWFRNLAVSDILIHTLEGLDMKFPKPTVDVSKMKL